MHGENPIESIDETTPTPSPRPVTTTSDRFFPSKIAQFRSEYQLKDHLKAPLPCESVTQIIDHSLQQLPKRSVSKVLSDQSFDHVDRSETPARRYSSSDIDYQSVQLVDNQTRGLIEQQKKRRTYNFNHTLFSSIYKRTHRSSSIDSHLSPPTQTTTNHRERSSSSRRRHLSAKESEVIDDVNTTSDRVYSRALEKTTLNPPAPSNSHYRTALSVPDGGTTTDSLIENRQSFSEATSRTRKLAFLSARRRASYVPHETSNGLIDESKRKRDVSWALKRSYSFDTPFHRETIEALNKGESLSSINKRHSFSTFACRTGSDFA